MKTRTKRKLLALGLCIVVFFIGVAIMTVTGLNGPLPMCINAAFVLAAWKLVPKGDDDDQPNNEDHDNPSSGNK